MSYLRREGKYLLQGMIVTLAFLTAIGTLSGVAFMFAVAIVPGWREKVGGFHNLQSQLMLASALQTIGWGFLPHIQFISRPLGRRMTIVMGTLTLFLLTLVLFSL